jgi:Uma2 family endonuclease
MTGPITPPRRPATFADIDALPEGISGELIDGVLYTNPRPTGPALLAATMLYGELHNTFVRGQGGAGGWWILQEPQLYLGSGSVIPDVAGWLRERMPRVPQDHRFELAPDWACEVLSPDRKNRRVERQQKPPLYHRAKVKHLWMLDPKERELEVFRWEEAGWLLLGTFGEDDKVRAEPFEQVELDMLLLWGETREAPGE